MWTTHGPPGGATALAIDPTHPGTLYVGTVGVFKSTDGAGSWTAADSGMTNAFYTVALAIDPTTPNTLYAGTDGGVFKSTDGAGSWTAANSGLPSPYVDALAIDPTTPSTLYAGTSGGGVFKSTDGAGSWAAVNSGLPSPYVDALAIDPTTPSTLYAGTETVRMDGHDTGGGVFKSTDGAHTWSYSGLTIRDVNALAIDPTTPTTLYAGSTYAGADPYGVLKSTDGGASWTAANSGLTNTEVLTLAIDPTHPGTLYAGSLYDGGKRLQEHRWRRQLGGDRYRVGQHKGSGVCHRPDNP